jgi:hypothetical protein
LIIGQKSIDYLLFALLHDSILPLFFRFDKPAAKIFRQSFLFLSGEKIRRAQKKSRENFFAGWRALV